MNDHDEQLEEFQAIRKNRGLIRINQYARRIKAWLGAEQPKPEAVGLKVIQKEADYINAPGKVNLVDSIRNTSNV